MTEGNRNCLVQAQKIFLKLRLKLWNFIFRFQKVLFHLRITGRPEKKTKKKQRQRDNVFAIYPQMDGKGTATCGQFKADDSPAGYMMLPCSVQLRKLQKLEVSLCSY